MKSYFIRLFNYDAHASKQVTALMLKRPQVTQPTALMAHMLVAQQTWLKRCKHLPAPGGPLWPDWTAESFNALIDANHAEWTAYLETLQLSDFDTIITYTNTKGEAFRNTLSDILAHVVNHGTHHRAQIGQYLKQAGAELPISDYIFYIRTLEDNL
ncbi:DinB family protein [Mucilaginibacter psychrotolerans]|uniref:Damage-inducible protein DinB n=1 Tax=Mucilaginibacter psychrotolerans TaxID=1524096 RepID=A0A4Y8S6W6_9SPHI|nr:DinB family protein [Mucilaginibacter psychrotolerans]TFF34688.1 hypothetical protein E2R66_21540 [Mucilaginibacter psychrotolerans]